MIIYVLCMIILFLSLALITSLISYKRLQEEYESIKTKKTDNLNQQQSED